MIAAGQGTSRVTRATIRELKRKVHAGMRHSASEIELESARESAVLLLQRSIAMRHDRLSLLRFVDALKLGAAIDARAWKYCAAVAGGPGCPEALRKIHPSLPTLVQEMNGRP